MFRHPQVYTRAAVRSIDEASFLSPEQKRDIFYNNAARFLRLTSEDIAGRHAVISHDRCLGHPQRSVAGGIKTQQHGHAPVIRWNFLSGRVASASQWRGYGRSIKSFPSCAHQVAVLVSPSQSQAVPPSAKGSSHLPQAPTRTSTLYAWERTPGTSSKGERCLIPCRPSRISAT